jgi:hypothetical protein
MGLFSSKKKKLPKKTSPPQKKRRVELGYSVGGAPDGLFPVLSGGGGGGSGGQSRLSHGATRQVTEP